MTTRAYLRVSTDAQDHQSQKAIIRAWADKAARPVDEWHTDQESGSTPWERRALAQVLAASAPNDAIIVSEISRIARSQLGVLGFLEAAAAAGVEVVAVKSGITLDRTMSSKIVVAVLALAAEIERDLIRERTKAALAARRAAGLPLGRQPGARIAKRLTPKADEIRTLLAAKVPKRAIARVLGCSPSTLYAYLRADPSATGDTKTLPLFPNPAPAE